MENINILNHNVLEPDIEEIDTISEDKNINSIPYGKVISARYKAQDEGIN